MRDFVASGFFACVAIGLFARTLSGQTQEPAARFRDVEIVASAPNSMEYMRARFAAGRYELRNATLVDLIRTAWSVLPNDIAGGPDWLDEKRFDLTAAAPADSSPELLRRMLRELLKDRFQLVLRYGSRDVPAYVITASRRPRLEKAEGLETGGCATEPPGHPAPFGAAVTYVCRNMTMAAFAAALPGIREASGYVFQYPVLDRTGLGGVWNFRLTWSPRNLYLRSHAASDTTTLFDAFEKDLGLKLSRARVPMPVLVVENAVAPRVVESPQPRLEFEVAEIRPENPENRMPGCSSVNVQRGGRVRIHMTLKGLIGEAWGDMSPDRIIGGKELMSTKCWEVLAKAPVYDSAAEGWNGPVWNGLDIDSMRQMLRSLVIDRFGIVAHIDERPMNGYFLLADKPKLREAQGRERAGCQEGPGPDGKDPRIQNPAASRLVTCRNMTLGRFVEEMNKEVFRSRPLVDMADLKGRYDITLNFSPDSMFTGTAPDGNTQGVASAPDGAISLPEAFRSQLGLKLEPRKVMAPALVIDQVNETPAEN